MADIDPMDIFSRSLIPRVMPSVSSPPIKRVPFMFTSTKRLLATEPENVSREYAKSLAYDRLRYSLDRIEKAGNPAAKAPNLNAQAAVIAASQNSQSISMMVNPTSIKWSEGKRFSKRDTMRGSTFFHFSDDAGRNADILTLTFTGTTGNIRSDGVNPDALAHASLRLKTWHNLYALTREPILLLDQGIENEFFITYRTVLMPMPITFIGFFNSPLEFTENANQPFMRDYTFGFTVTNTSPDLDKLVDKLTSVLYPTPNPTTFGAR